MTKNSDKVPKDKNGNDLNNIFDSIGRKHWMDEIVGLNRFWIQTGGKGTNELKEECKEERDKETKKKQSGYLSEEYEEDRWTVDVLQHSGKDTSDWSIIASVNGKITHGDRFRIRLIWKGYAPGHS